MNRNNVTNRWEKLSSCEVAIVMRGIERFQLWPTLHSVIVSTWRLLSTRATTFFPRNSPLTWLFFYFPFIFQCILRRYINRFILFYEIFFVNWLILIISLIEKVTGLFITQIRNCLLLKYVGFVMIANRTKSYLRMLKQRGKCREEFKQNCSYI